ncbi:MAG: hypothetical protein WCJ01_07335 [Ignavibacteria bacterium]
MKIEERSGKVTYQSSQNTYVEFKETEGIKQGDTLYINYQPAMIVSYISSHSCAGTVIGKSSVKIGDVLIARVKINVTTAAIKENKSDPIPGNKNVTDEAISIPGKNTRKTKMDKVNVINGKFSVQSYSSFSNYPGSINTQRWRYSISSETKNILGSSLSFSNYLTFSYNASEWEKVRNSIGSNIRVYDLSLQYDLTKSTHIQAGRYINPKISSISSIDGLQIEQKWSKYYAGFVAGSRPDFSNFGYNLKLFEAGAYAGRSDTLLNGIMNNTLAFFNQTNDSKTDRRFLYFQHDNYIMSNVNFFVSSEIDMYKKEKGVDINSPSLTSLYVISRYSPLRWLSFSLSYDARKSVVYYETFKSFYDSLFVNETRQGIRGGISLRPVNNLYIGFDAGSRSEKSDLKPSRNYSGFLSYSGVPVLNLDLSLNASQITGSYLDALLYGISFSRDIFAGHLYATGGYRRAEYSFYSVNDKQIQNILSLDLSILLTKNLYLITSYEGVFEKTNSNSRALIEISSRF